MRRAAAAIAFLIVASPAHAQQWTVQSDVDRFTNKQTVVLGVGDPRSTFLNVSCFSETGPMLIIGLPHEAFSGQSFDAMLRIDDQPPSKAGFVGMKGSNLLATRLSRQTYLRLSTAHQISMRINRGDGQVQDVDVRPSTSKRAFDKLFAACPPGKIPLVAPAVADPEKPMSEPGVHHNDTTTAPTGTPKSDDSLKPAP